MCPRRDAINEPHHGWQSRKICAAPFVVSLGGSVVVNKCSLWSLCEVLVVMIIMMHQANIHLTSSRHLTPATRCKLHIRAKRRSNSGSSEGKDRGVSQCVCVWWSEWIVSVQFRLGFGCLVMWDEPPRWCRTSFNHKTQTDLRHTNDGMIARWSLFGLQLRSMQYVYIIEKLSPRRTLSRGNSAQCGVSIAMQWLSIRKPIYTKTHISRVYTRRMITHKIRIGSQHTHKHTITTRNWVIFSSTDDGITIASRGNLSACNMFERMRNHWSCTHVPSCANALYLV